jgi:hypothetical protein
MLQALKILHGPIELAISDSNQGIDVNKRILFDLQRVGGRAILGLLGRKNFIQSVAMPTMAITQ